MLADRDDGESFSLTLKKVRSLVWELFGFLIEQILKE